MRSLLWKELRENAGWAIILFAGVAVALGVWAMAEMPWGRIDESINSDDVLGILLIAAPLGALALGLLQILPELQRDAWAYLVHRPVSPTRIFLAKTIVGTGLYLAAILVPFLLVAVCVAAWAPERHLFHPLMLWPGTAIVLSSAGLHGAAMLVALRRARWLRTRLLPIALPAGSLVLTLACVLNVSELPSMAIVLSILAAHAVTTLAAWGAFVRSGEAAGQPRVARAALGISLGLGVLGVLGSLLGGVIGAVGELLPPRIFTAERGNADERRVEDWNVMSLIPAFHTIQTGTWPGRERVARSLMGAWWTAGEWIQSTDGVIYGYREEARGLPRYLQRWRFRLARIVGPDGFREPFAKSPGRFGPILSACLPHRDSLPPDDPRRRQQPWRLADSIDTTRSSPRLIVACASGIYDIDFTREEVRLLVAAPEGDTICGFSVEGTFEGGAEFAIATDRSVRFFSAREEIVGWVTDEGTGKRTDFQAFFPDREIFTAAIPAAIRGALESSFAVARVPGRGTCLFASGRDSRMYAPERLFEADASGKILRRRDTLDAGGDSELARAAFLGAATFAPLGLVGAVAIADEALISGDGPGYLRLSAAERPGWMVVFAAVLALQALVCGGAALAAARRHGFSRARRRLWASIGALLGPAGLVALAGTRDWSPTPACAACGRPRAVSIDVCPYCAARLEPPPRDGTEVIESVVSGEPTVIPSRSKP